MTGYAGAQFEAANWNSAMSIHRVITQFVL